MKKSEEKIKCLFCRVEALKYPTLSYKEPRKFCSRKCYTDHYKETFPHGDKHPLWKGRKAHYITQHQWISRNFGKATRCEHCTNTKSKRYHWANISGKYIRSVKDYKQLCVSCHRIFDLARKEK